MFEQDLLPGFEAPPTATHRLFFALQPDAAAGARIAELTPWLQGEHGLRGKALDAQRLHMTLYFLGDFIGLPEPLVARAEETAAALAEPAFDVMFDRVASFSQHRKTSPLVLLTDGNNGPLKAFWLSLSSAMKKAGLPPAARETFTPHVTLMYADRRVAEHAVEPITWEVENFVLVASLIGQTRHLSLTRWPLRPRRSRQNVQGSERPGGL